MTPVIPLGIRLNNPGCVFKSATKWRGEVDSPHPDLCQFDTPDHGIRAVGIILRTYQKKYKIRTIRQAITRYAPPATNNTTAYIADVCERTKIGADAIIDFNDVGILARVVKGIIQHENGYQPYPEQLITNALKEQA